MAAPGILGGVSTESSAVTLIAAADAPAGAADPTRRHALLFPDGRARFAGIARDEADEVVPAISRRPDADWDRLLVEVALPVVLSDGAGPYLLDDAGRVTLAIAAHPSVEGAHVAMGAPAPGHRIGVVRRALGARLWEWIADAVVAPARRVEALDGIDRAADAGDLDRWQRREREHARRERAS
jgi:hypothetical protein